MTRSILSYKLYYFLGIGGIGMSALARYFHKHNKKVIGYDKTESILTNQLQYEGIECYYQENIKQLQNRLHSYSKEEILVIYTPAIPNDHQELQHFQTQHFDLLKRAEVLSRIVNPHQCIAVAGTHGKTTTTALITHLFHQAQQNMIAFVGGIMTNYNTNFIQSIPHPEKPIYTITEADEYDYSFLHLHPQTAVITSIDADHLDIYQTHENLIHAYQQFAQQVSPKGSLIVHKSVDKFFPNHQNLHTFAVNLNGQIWADNLTFSNNTMQFDLHLKNKTYKAVELGIPGIHNVLNALAAIGVARHYNLPMKNIFQALKTFKGVKRRFEYHIKNDKLILIDDYAHHPEEIKTLLQSVRLLYPSKKITSIFQPHLYSRTRDFMNEFATILASYADEIILLDIYPARESPIPGITSQTLLNHIQHPHKKLLSKSELPNYLAHSDHQVILTIGAGDIDLLIPAIKQQLGYL